MVECLGLLDIYAEKNHHQCMCPVQPGQCSGWFAFAEPVKGSALFLLCLRTVPEPTAEECCLHPSLLEVSVWLPEQLWKYNRGQADFLAQNYPSWQMACPAALPEWPWDSSTAAFSHAPPAAASFLPVILRLLGSTWEEATHWREVWTLLLLREMCKTKEVGLWQGSKQVKTISCRSI